MARFADPNDPIILYLAGIADKDPDALGGIRTTNELAARYSLTKDAARYHLTALEAEGLIECVGIVQCEKGRPYGWKVAA